MTMVRAGTVRSAVILMCGLALSGSVLAAGAAKPKKPAAKAGATAAALPPAVLAQLKSDDPGEIRAGLDDTRMAGKEGSAAGPQIIALLGSGLPYPLAEAAIDTLGDIESPDGPAAVAPYAKHREVKIRRAAIRALAKAVGAAGVPVAATALRSALSDPDAQVRALAATGLGSLKAKVAVLDLFLALDHHVYEAAVSIGQLCDAAECDTLVGRLGKIPFDVVTTGLDQILFRPASEVSDDQKISVVNRVRDLGTRDANKFLKNVESRWSKTASAKVRRAIDDAVAATLSSPGGSL